MHRLKTLARLTLTLILAALTALSFAQTETEKAIQHQTLTCIQALKTSDWKALYGVIQFSPKLAGVFTPEHVDDFAKGFAEGMQGKDAREFEKLMKSITSYSVGSPVIEGPVAYVPTKFEFTISGTPVTFMGIAKMTKLEDTWKWDLSGSEDLGQMIGKGFGQLVGGAVLQGN